MRYVATVCGNEEVARRSELHQILYMHERVKFLPIADVWNEYLHRQGLSEDWWDEVEKFENEVILRRV